ncbi:MAG: DUF134 domain-containing protein [Candidatus Pacearchaeota archaeon]
MARPLKTRKVAVELKCDDFVPAVPVVMETLYLTRDELEALRLKDALALEQKKAAKFMGISQPTFHRILLKARRKVSEAIVEAKELKIKEWT